MEAHGASEAEPSLAERMETLHRQIGVRDTRQAELVGIMAEPHPVDNSLTNAWLQLEIAQGDVDYIVKREIQRRLQD